MNNQELTNERIIAIADETQTAESRDGDYILPISFARAIEREVRLSAVREARNWQPIATVPMDGSEVLLYLQAPFTRVVKARWFDVWENWIEGEFPDPQDEYCGIGSRVPTHWMPVPEAPAASKEGGTGNG
jgi:hypothetical protein